MASGPRIKSGDTGKGAPGCKAAKRATARGRLSRRPGRAPTAYELNRATNGGQTPDRVSAGQAAPAEPLRGASAKMAESEGSAGLATRLVFVQESGPGCGKTLKKSRKPAI